MRPGLLLALLALAAAPACSKKACEIPAELPRPVLEGPTADQPRRLMPVTGYTLALSWSPERCTGRMTSPMEHIRCGGGADSFGFTLHGLWPDGDDGWPQYCEPARLVSDEVIRDQLCTTPSPQLIQHEWEKHGSCMAKNPDEYFARGRALVRGLRFPDMDDLRGRTMTVAEFERAFAEANSGMRPEQMRLRLGRDGWLEDVLICLDGEFERAACPAARHGAPLGQTLRIR
jgi:ribonuclease T2